MARNMVSRIMRNTSVSLKSSTMALVMSCMPAASISATCCASCAATLPAGDGTGCVACSSSGASRSDGAACACGAAPAGSSGAFNNLDAALPGKVSRPIAAASSISFLRATAVADNRSSAVMPMVGEYCCATRAIRASSSRGSVRSSVSAIAFAATAIQRRRSIASAGTRTGGSPVGLRIQRRMLSGKPQTLATPRPKASKLKPSTLADALASVAGGWVDVISPRTTRASSGK